MGCLGWHCGAREAEPAIFTSTLSTTVDLPRDWQYLNKPVLMHLFGQITAMPGFALTEEDRVEFMCHLQSNIRRPEMLFDELRTRHLLFLGNRFPDWFGRLFLRALKGTRFSEETETVEALVEDHAHTPPPLRLYTGFGASPKRPDDSAMSTGLRSSDARQPAL